jgi:hypothetical protein
MSSIYFVLAYDNIFVGNETSQYVGKSRTGNFFCSIIAGQMFPHDKSMFWALNKDILDSVALREGKIAFSVIAEKSKTKF